MSDLMSNFNIKDKSGTLHQYEIKDASARQEIDSAKDLDFDENQFEITETDTEVKIKVNVFSGATNVSKAGVGLVPSAALTDTNKYLKGDGTWAPVQELTDDQVSAISSVSGISEEVNSINSKFNTIVTYDAENAQFIFNI